MRHEVGTILAWALRAQHGSGPHAELARQVVLAVIVAHLVAAGGHDGPPHPSKRPPRMTRPRRQRMPYHDALAGRRPRG